MPFFFPILFGVISNLMKVMLRDKNYLENLVKFG